MGRAVQRLREELAELLTLCLAIMNYENIHMIAIAGYAQEGILLTISA